MNRQPLSGGFGDDDFGNLWDATEAADDRGPIPAGTYEARILSGERFEARSGTPGYKLAFEIRDGEFQGRRVWLDLWLSKAALPYTKAALAKIGVTRPEQLSEPIPPGIIARVRVALRKSDDGAEFNTVKAFDVLRVEQPEPDPFAPTEDEAGEGDGQADDQTDDGMEEFEL